MKFVVFKMPDNTNIAINRDQVVTVEDHGTSTALYLVGVTDEDPRPYEFFVQEDFFTVVSRLNTIAG